MSPKAVLQGLCVPIVGPTHLPISEQRRASAATAALGYTWLCGLEFEGSQRQRPRMRSTRATAARARSRNRFFMALWGRGEGQAHPEPCPKSMAQSPASEINPCISFQPPEHAPSPPHLFRSLPLPEAPGPISAPAQIHLLVLTTPSCPGPLLGTPRFHSAGPFLSPHSGRALHFQEVHSRRDRPSLIPSWHHSWAPE